MNLGQTEVAKDIINNALDTVEDFCNQKGLARIKKIRECLTHNQLNKAISLSKNVLDIYAHENERDAGEDSDLGDISNDLIDASNAEKLLGNNDLASRLDIVSYEYLHLYAIQINNLNKPMVETFVYNQLPHDLDKAKIDQSTKDKINDELNTILFSHNSNRVKRTLKETKEALL